MLIDWLQHERLDRRVAAGLAVGLVCMYAAWTVGFFLLPEGVLRGRTGAGAASLLLPEGASVFLLASIWNGAVAFVLMPLVCLVAVRRLSLGYVLAWGNFALFGLFLGTNSFSHPRPAAVPPGLGVFASTGVWEISAYALVAAALANRYRFRQSGWLSGATTRVPRAGDRLSNGSRGLLIVAAGLIVLTAWVEDRRAAPSPGRSSQPHALRDPERLLRPDGAGHPDRVAWSHSDRCPSTPAVAEAPRSCSPAPRLSRRLPVRARAGRAGRCPRPRAGARGHTMPRPQGTAGLLWNLAGRPG